MTAIEHAAVHDTARALGSPAVLPVDGEGIAAPDADLPPDVGLVCVMAVNNEIGTVQPLAEWCARARDAGALLLCDAVQGYGKLDLTTLEADMIAVSAHKLYGPKGIGALWVRDGIALDPQITGGLQEGLRSGTLSPALAAGFGAAARLAREQFEADRTHARTLFDRALALLPRWTLNGSRAQRNFANLSLRRDGLDVARLMSEARELMISAGSACASGSGRTSHVLAAIGLSREQAKSTVRIGTGRYTSLQQIEEAAAILNAAAEAQGV